MTLKVGILVGEKSGDILGASLLKALKKRFPDLTAEGIAGPLMQAEGCKSLYDMERLSVMGFVEPLKRLPELFKMRAELVKHFTENKPDVFIGIDAPAFNTGLELKLREAGIKVVHYVSPSVWAWRKKRIHKIKKAVDMMLTLLPFENKIYDEHQIPNQFVGHPLADQIPLEVDAAAARRNLQIDAAKKTLALLPGSRMGEVTHLAKPFLEAAKLVADKNPGLQIIVPLASEKTYQVFQDVLKSLPYQLPIRCFHGRSADVLAAADVVLIASGTATLEAMLYNKPMVVAYKLSKLNYYLAKMLVKTKYFSLPNLLANERLIPEILQNDATAENLAREVQVYFDEPEKVATLQVKFKQLHLMLRQNASERAAEAVASVVRDKQA